MTEAVTNAVRHGSPPVSVELVNGPAHLRMEVTDGSDVVPRVSEDGGDQEGRSRLALVEALTESWGVTLDTGGGKTIWFLFRKVANAASASWWVTGERKAGRQDIPGAQAFGRSPLSAGGAGGGPRKVLVRRSDCSEVVRPFRGAPADLSGSFSAGHDV